MKNIAVFASGGGSNFKAIHNHILSGNIPGEIVLVVSNNPNCGAITYAEENALSTGIVNNTPYPIPVTRDNTLLQALLKAEIDLICLILLVINFIIFKFSII